MIRFFVEAKRRLAWQARLDVSSLRLEVVEGDKPALWVFDSLHDPDGYALRDMILRLAHRERLKLFSFGPRDSLRLPSERLMRAVMPGSDHSFVRKVAKNIERAALECGAAVFVVGSAKGTFADAIPAAAEIWEVQHGLLDPSYFPLRANRFFTRSATSRALLEDRIPAARLAILTDDLSPPKTAPGDLRQATALVCYSKNPGGGCTAAELIRFERATVSLAHRLDLPFHLKLHPRDNSLKLITRHRGFSMRRHLRPLDCGHAGPRLVVSSFSTALTSETHTGDLLLNVALSQPDPITAVEYNWLPTVAVTELNDPTVLPVMERL